MAATAAVHAFKPSHSYAIRPMTVLREISHTSVRCTNCHSRNHCVMAGLTPEELGAIPDSALGHRRVRRGEALYQAGEGFRSVYAVRLGFFKSFVVTEDGRSQITGFQMAGDLLGIDGIAEETHAESAVALEDSDVCVLSYRQLDPASSGSHSLHRQLQRILSREIVREHGTMILLGSMRAEERLAIFLLNLAERYQRRGYSSTDFVLRMTREEIGSYLGLKLETVSRLFSRFQEEGLLQVQGRVVKLLDLTALKRLAGQRC
jgi:CRP/FNR family transcriptional regulator, anaerobic regulatory protein